MNMDIFTRLAHLQVKAEGTDIYDDIAGLRRVLIQERVRGAIANEVAQAKHERRLGARLRQSASISVVGRWVNVPKFLLPLLRELEQASQHDQCITTRELAERLWGSGRSANQTRALRYIEILRGVLSTQECGLSIGHWAQHGYYVNVEPITYPTGVAS